MCIETAAVLCVDGLVIDGGSGRITRQELIAEGVDQLLVSVHGEHALPDCDDDQLIREAAHPVLGLNAVSYTHLMPVRV